MTQVQVNGASISYREQGQAAPVLLIHGTGTYTATFEPLLAELPSDLRGIAYDRRGHGEPANPHARSLTVHVADAAGLIDAVAGGPVTVVGSSGGGVVALRLAIASTIERETNG